MQINRKFKYPIIILLLIIGYFLLISQTNNTVCLFKNITGVPCAGCGTTRATILLFNGNFKQSILTNPLGIIFVFLSIISITWMSIDFYKKTDSFYRFLCKKRSFYAILPFILLTILNWIWNIVKGI